MHEESAKVSRLIVRTPCPLPEMHSDHARSKSPFHFWPRSFPHDFEVDPPESDGDPYAPAKGFWCRVWERAWRETCEALRLDTPTRIAITVGAPTAAFVFIAAVVGQPAWSGVATVGVILLIGLCMLLQRVFSIPSEFVREAELRGLSAATRQQEIEFVRRMELVDRLAAFYVATSVSDSAKLRAGLELPPADWINEQLREQGEPWTVFAIRGTRYSIIER